MRLRFRRGYSEVEHINHVEAMYGTYKRDAWHWVCLCGANCKIGCFHEKAKCACGIIWIVPMEFVNNDVRRIFIGRHA